MLLVILQRYNKLTLCIILGGVICSFRSLLLFHTIHLHLLAFCPIKIFIHKQTTYLQAFDHFGHTSTSNNISCEELIFTNIHYNHNQQPEIHANLLSVVNTCTSLTTLHLFTWALPLCCCCYRSLVVVVMVLWLLLLWFFFFCLLQLQLLGYLLLWGCLFQWCSWQHHLCCDWLVLKKL